MPAHPISEANQTKQSELSVTYVPLESLGVYPRNARTHSKHQIRQIAKSIQEFGFTNPIIVDGQNTIVAGHGRLRAAQLLDLERVPTIRLESLTDDQIRAYVLADNKLAENAGWDKAILAIELQHLMTIEESIDITITGFEIPEIDLILQDGTEKDPDDTPEPVAGSAITKVGDLWLLGKHRVLCSNSLDDASFSYLTNDRQAQMVFVDPPYNVAIDGHVSGNGAVKHREFAMATGEMSADEFTNFLTDSLSLLARHSVPGSVHFVCMDWRHQHEPRMLKSDRHGAVGS
jgi:ParB-like nuclease domain